MAILWVKCLVFSHIETMLVAMTENSSCYLSVRPFTTVVSSVATKTLRFGNFDTPTSCILC